MCAASPSAAAARLARGSFGRRQSRDWLGARDAAGGGRRSGPHRRIGASLEPGLGPARSVLSPGLSPRSPGAYLPALGSPELPRWPRCPKQAPNPGAPTRGPSPQPRSEMPAGEGRPGPCARFPLSLRIPLIRGLSAAPRLQGCRGRPAGVLETVPSLSPFIKRPWAALKPRSQ